MHLTPKEQDRLLLFTAAQLARRRRDRGVRLNYPEARALIADEILEGARDGLSVSELMRLGGGILTSDEVLPGVAKLMGTLQVEGMFPDGQKLVTIHQPIKPTTGSEPDDEPGRVVTQEGTIELSPGRAVTSLVVINAGDRPVQVGSHFHFFEVNRALQFDREAAYGFHLDIPAGTAVRFEPGEAREVGLVAFGGDATVHGLNSLTEGPTDDASRPAVMERARARGFLGEE